MLLLILLLGCPKGEPEPAEPAPEAAPSAPAPEPAAEAETPCVEACVRSRAMEARAPEAIEADCRAECGADEAPVVDKGDQLPLHLGQRVTVTGTLVLAPGGASLELADGTRVLVDSEGYPHGWEGLAAHRVRVTGTVEARDGGLLLANPDAPLPVD